ncbi:MAG: hypothetical protein HY069_02540, partial [Chlamydiia bacterium]|nr:hypothetical protein [Chlamydiia bacterium]
MKSKLKYLLIIWPFVMQALNIAVTSTADTNTMGTLRYAINQINASPGMYTGIDFSSLTNPTITLTEPLPMLQAGVGNSLSTVGTSAGNIVTINGASTYRGLLVVSGNVTLSYINFSNCNATGGNGGGTSNGGGGGGGGLGGGLFVYNGAAVTASNCNFTSNQAVGGAGGTSPNISTGAGGGGLQGNGGQALEASAGNSGGGGGGYFGNGGTGLGVGLGVGGAGGGGGGGSFQNGANASSSSGAAGGSDGGGNGGSSIQSGFAGSFGGGGGGGGANDSSNFAGGSGGVFGGGGGGGLQQEQGPLVGGGDGGTGGFAGGGGGAVLGNGGNGGFAGGGGGNLSGTWGQPGTGGYGGGNGSIAGGTPGGGGGAGFGGAVFVMQGGSLVLQGTSAFTGSSVTAGIGFPHNGSVAGTDFFINSGGILTFSQTGTLTIATSIDGDALNSAGTLSAQGGPLVLSGANTFLASVSVSNTTLIVSSNSALGNSANTATLNNTATLQFGASVTLPNSLVIGNTGAQTIDTQTFTTGVNGISGAGFSKIGSGSLTLSGGSSYSAATINSGTFRAGAANVFSSSGLIQLSLGTTLDLNNHSNVIGNLSGSGTVTLGSGTLSLGGDNTSQT